MGGFGNSTMSEQEKLLIAKCGWLLECESPFEISCIAEPQSRATGLGAKAVLEHMKAKPEDFVDE